MLPEQLTINGVTYVRQDLVADSECTLQQCTYYTHYLVFHDPNANGPQLEHPAYHEAEQRCTEAQDKLMQWMDEHKEVNFDANAIYKSLEKNATFWERKVAA